MDHVRFDDITRSLGTPATRRGLVRLLTRSSLAVLAGSAFGASHVDAKKKRHKKKKKAPLPPPAFNQFGCLDVGQPCAGDSSQCCSGVCEGSPPKKGKADTRVCAAHNAGACTTSRNRCNSVDPGLAICNPNSQFAACLVTTGNAPFCGTLFNFDPAVTCQTCSKDADCLAVGFPSGSACVQLGGTFCNGCEATQNRACLPPADPA
jgi:hypothetical protein